MDKLTQYRQAIIEILTDFSNGSKGSTSKEEMEEQLILDTQRDHYQILTIGWNGIKRVYYPVFHIDIKNNKIWVQEDATDFDFVGELEKRGIPKSDIVLAFHSPFKRPLTDYAVA